MSGEEVDDPQPPTPDMSRHGQAFLRLIDENHKHGGSLVALAFAVTAWRSAYADDIQAEEDRLTDAERALRDMRRVEVRALVANFRERQKAEARAGLVSQ
jgi:hypothetical protein